jgi:antitoxin HicB
MVLVHGFIKKSQKTPKADLDFASRRASKLREDDEMDEKHLGSDFDDFLREEGLLDDAEAVACKRILAYQIAQAMEQRNLTKAAMARRMGTSRSSLDRLLDPRVPSVTLLTIEKAARVLGKRVRVEFTESDA